MRTDPREVSGRSFDLLIIGGGIQGAAVAREAALRGISTLLVDGGDFAGGATSGGSGLIAGERGAALERESLLRLAPHLVRPLPLLRPVYGGPRPNVVTARGSTLPAAEWHEPAGCARLFPGLRSAGLSGGLLYFEAATNGARLTIALVAAAATAGARVCNHVEVVGSCGAAVLLIDRIAEREIEVHARHVVNAAGAQVDAVRPLLGIGGGDRARAVSVDHQILDPIDGEVGLAIADSGGATRCAVPHHDALVWGPLEDESAPALASLLEEPPRVREVRTAQCALPVTSEDDAIVIVEESAVGTVLSVVGARLSTHRAVAEDVVQRMGAAPRPSPTRTSPVPGGGGPREVGDPLWWRHGSRAWLVRDLARGQTSLLEPVCPHRPFLGVEVLYALRAQGAVTLDDVGRRLSDERGPCTEDECTRRLHELYAGAS